MAPHRKTPSRILEEPAEDGRVRRSQRSGQAIVEALMELIGEGVVEPTAQQVAERARVGIRTVFRRFSDVESLYAEMDARLQERYVPLLHAGRVSGGIEERARALAARRAAFFERIAPFKRSGNLKRWRSPFLSDRHALLVRALRSDLLERIPELRQASAAVLAAVELLTAIESWDRLRLDQGLGVSRAQAAVEAALLALVSPLGEGRRRKAHD